ncbi:hypothetical protein SPRG_12151 [Saprolegnia parasitica CBS 223.65]|uniref:Uncharacterized protein n=1 Tax=Saprolegnia parasitica (strain CBS 223.65) TaxID=695850 RepID=A0A067BW54_SAPPC|nr:hypothetical protein SPRG_12151 [Saprolegnia parasitica CBS 223.65]KDO22724.1 hypothetical protein SPRG_12151 [Saprolegnia parasitica CBS 223.65]|eukprot:XP_012206515.1 hypothetical protein SPRG_12151 [Saprolegnia parasitica CBS 223.65]
MTAATLDLLHDVVEYRLTKRDIASVLELNDGNVARTIDELLSMLKIQDMERKGSIDATADVVAADSKLQWDLFLAEMGTHGLDEATCTDLLQALQDTCGGDHVASSTIVHELLAAMDDAPEEEDHPIAVLQDQFPHVRSDLIQEIFEQNEYDVAATTNALSETGHLLNANGSLETYSYASMAKGPAHKSKTGAKSFPSLQSRRSSKRRVVQWGKHAPRNAWETNDQALPTGTPGSLSTKLKLEYLQKRLPNVDADILCTALLLNNANLETTEAIVSSIFNIPLESAPSSNQDEQPPKYHPPRHRTRDDAPDGFVQYQARTEALIEALQQTHSAAVRSFAGGKLNHHLGRDKMQRVSSLRRELQITREQAAYAFFDENKYLVKAGGTVDMHGLFLQEALHVLDYCLDFAKKNRVRKFMVVTGVGNHATKPGKMFNSIDASLARRGVKYTKGPGHFVIQPFYQTT